MTGPRLLQQVAIVARGSLLVGAVVELREEVKAARSEENRSWEAEEVETTVDWHLLALLKHSYKQNHHYHMPKFCLQLVKRSDLKPLWSLLQSPNLDQNMSSFCNSNNSVLAGLQNPPSQPHIHGASVNLGSKSYSMKTKLQTSLPSKVPSALEFFRDTQISSLSHVSRFCQKSSIRGSQRYVRHIKHLRL